MDMDQESHYSNVTEVPFKQIGIFPHNCVPRIYCEDQQGHSHHVSGVIIAQRQILTSAHLFFKVNHGQMRVLKPKYIILEGRNQRNQKILVQIWVQDFKYNERYEEHFKAGARALAAGNLQQYNRILTESVSYDYALLKLTQPVQRNVQRKRYPVLCPIVNPNEIITILGFGSQGNNYYPFIKRRGRLNIIDGRAEYDINTKDGMSGGPIYSMISSQRPYEIDECRVYAIHQHFHYNQQTRSGKGVGAPVTPQMIHDIRKWQAQMGLSAGILFSNQTNESIGEVIRRETDHLIFQKTELQNVIREMQQQNERQRASFEEEKARCYIRIAELEDRIRGETQTPPMKWFYDQGYKFQVAKRWDEAIDCFRKEIKHHPENNSWCLFYNLAYCLQMRDPIMEIIHYYMRAVEQNPTRDDIYNMLEMLFWNKTRQKKKIMTVIEHLGRVSSQRGGIGQAEKMKGALEKLYNSMN